MQELSRLTFEVNGTVHTVAIRPDALLLDVLRDDLGLRGTKASCERAVCGACTCLLDGTPVASCSVFAFECEGRAVETVEGLGRADDLTPVQRAFAQCSAFQCGFCTPGMVMTATALLREVERPDRATIREWMESNICRCTGYELIFEAVERAVELRDGAA